MSATTRIPQPTALSRRATCARPRSSAVGRSTRSRRVRPLGFLRSKAAAWTLCSPCDSWGVFEGRRVGVNSGSGTGREDGSSLKGASRSGTNGKRGVLVNGGGQGAGASEGSAVGGPALGGPALGGPAPSNSAGAPRSRSTPWLSLSGRSPDRSSMGPSSSGPGASLKRGLVTGSVARQSKGARPSRGRATCRRTKSWCGRVEGGCASWRDVDAGGQGDWRLLGGSWAAGRAWGS